MFILNIQSIYAFNDDLFRSLLEKPIPDWMETQINADLLKFSKKDLHVKNIRGFFKEDNFGMMIYISICNGQIQINHNQRTNKGILEAYNQCFNHLNSLVQLPNLECIISFEDALILNDNMPLIPILTVSKKKSLNNLILFPDWAAVNGYKPSHDQTVSGSLKYPWAIKKNVIFWRGTSTGIFNLEKWLSFPRSKLIQLSLENPSVIDARFVGIHQKEIEKEAKALGYLGNWVSMTKHGYYKYLIDVDGNSSTWPRCYCLLLSNSVMLKQCSENIQWFYIGLESYKHYIPITDDLSDLLPQYNWAVQNDNLCQQIANNGTCFAKQHLSHEAVYLYIYKLLERYSELQEG